MLKLPQGGEGLGWIVSQGPSQLLLIPGLQPASITAAAAGDANALAYLCFTAQHYAAHGSGDLSLLDELCSRAAKITNNAEHRAFSASLDCNSVLSQAWNSRQEFTVDLLLRAAQSGQLAALQWLRGLCHQTWQDDRGLIEGAARHGHLEVLKFLRSGPRPAQWNLSVAVAATRHQECLEWLLLQEPPCPCDVDTVDAAARLGNLPALQFLHSHHESLVSLSEWDEYTLNAAVASGSLKVLKWLRSQNLALPDEWETSICKAAAERGDMSMLQWARSTEPPCPWGSEVTAAAASNGNLGMLQWLRAQQPPCPFSSRCTARAARAGRLDALQWLRAQQCPWDESCTAAAANRSLLHILKWVRAQHPPCPWDPHCTLRAVEDGNHLLLVWLLDHGCPVHPEAAREAVCRAGMLSVHLLSIHGHMPSGQQYYEAAQLGHLSMFRWLVCTRVPVCKVRPPWLSTASISGPMLLCLGDIKAPLPRNQQAELMALRKAHCTFHGLVRWCRAAVSDPSKGMHRAFDGLAANASGQNLLVRLSMLPSEILSRIALAAGLQHTLFQSLDDDHLYPCAEQVLSREDLESPYLLL
ncbi:hypothetical protein WJX74_007243 [Apatococcus lobatus]|uniref:Uncharacterized protein n=1 Tax=Apatococcus lobatus TaxID=904363 RepID=A0AAW1S394_9CHLO